MQIRSPRFGSEYYFRLTPDHQQVFDNSYWGPKKLAAIEDQVGQPWVLRMTQQSVPATVSYNAGEGTITVKTPTKENSFNDLAFHDYSLLKVIAEFLDTKSLPNDGQSFFARAACERHIKRAAHQDCRSEKPSAVLTPQQRTIDINL